MDHKDSVTSRNGLPGEHPPGSFDEFSVFGVPCCRCFSAARRHGKVTDELTKPHVGKALAQLIDEFEQLNTVTGFNGS
jgi:hypothetical protein